MDMHMKSKLTYKILKNARLSKFYAQDGQCYYCHQPMWTKSSTEFCRKYRMSEKQAVRFQCTAEHLLARCDGGSDIPSNIVAACKYCNRTRHVAKIALSAATYKDKVRRRLLSGRWHGFLVRPIIANDPNQLGR